MTGLDQSIRQVVAATFGLDPATVDENASRETIAQWDSLGQIGLVLALEEHFGVSIEMSRIAGLVSFQAVRQVMENLTQPAN